MDEHECDAVQVGVAADGVHSAFRFRNKKRSKVWEEYKPIFVNGRIQSAECRYCQTRMTCKDANGNSNGTSHLWRHQKICPVKEGYAQRQQNDVYLPFVMANDNDPVNQIIQDSLNDINLVTPSENGRFKSKVWNEFRPIYVDGRLQGADCIHCHKRLSADKGRSHLNRHIQTCPARGGSSQSHQKGLFFSSSVPTLKSRVQDELSPALTNGRVQIAEYASKLLKNNSSSDTTPLRQHILALPAVDSMIQKEQNTSYVHVAPDITSPKEQNTSYVCITPDISTKKFDQEAPYQELARMVLLHGYPLSIGEHEEMRKFAKSLNPMFNMASRIDMEEYSTLLFQKEKADLKEKISRSSRRVSLSASIWTNHGAELTMKFLSLTAHFVDEDWKLQRRIIKFGVFWSSLSDLERLIYCKEAFILESEVGPYNVIGDAIRDWNLDQKLLSLTSDSEIRNNEGTLKLKDILMERNCLPIRGELYNIACVDDALNTIVSDVQPNLLHLVGDVLEKFIGAHVSSSLSQQQLLEVVSQMGLKCPQEDAKWWHKIYFRLEALLHFKKAFPSEEVLSPEDIKIAESVCKILRTFYRAIEVISGPICPTANLYFNELWKVRTILQEEASNDHIEVASMVREMQEVFKEYWQNSYLWLSIPVVLDPRFKISFIDFRLNQAFGTDAAKYVSVIRETMRAVFHEYCVPLDKLSGGTSNCEGHDVEMAVDDNDSLEDWDQHLSAQTRTKISTELDNYLEDGLVPRKDDFDILQWWMSHATKYPTLAVIAQDILAMPASAVHSEAALSSNGRVIPKHHSTLNIKTIEALVCTQDWIR